MSVVTTTIIESAARPDAIPSCSGRNPGDPSVVCPEDSTAVGTEIRTTTLREEEVVEPTATAIDPANEPNRGRPNLQSSSLTTSLPAPIATTATIATTSTTGIPEQSLIGNSTNPSQTPAAGQTSSGSSGVSGGTVAGVAIGCLIAGAAIAALILFLLHRRRRSQQPTFYGQQHLPQNDPHRAEKNGIVTTAPVAQHVASKVDHMLPPPAEDAAITQTLSKIRDNIKNHVKSYYHVDPVPATAIHESVLSELGAETGLRSSALLGMFVNPSTRHAAIRLYIGWVATTRCSGDRYPSFLPDEIARLAVNMPGQDNKNKDQTALLSKWKVITGTLLQQRFGQTVTDSDSRAGAVAEAINQIDAALAPFLARNIDIAHRRRNLEMIMGRSAQLAYLLFSQPGSFQFDLGNPGARNSLVVFPALLQTVNDQGQVVTPPRLLCEKEDVKI